MRNETGIEITIPRFAEPLRIEQIVSEHTGTLAFDRNLIAGVAERLRRLAERDEADIFG